MRRATRKELLRRPWTPTPDHVITARDLSHGAVRAYLCIMRLIRYKDSVECTASALDIAESYGVKQRAFFYHRAELVKGGYISIRNEVGKPSVHILLAPEIEGQKDMFEAEPAQDIARVPTQDIARVPTQDIARVPLLSLSRLSERDPEERKAAAANTKAMPLLHDAPARPPCEFSTAAAAFLSQFFNQGDAEKLIREHGAAKVLHVKRQLAVRQSTPKNTPGLIRVILRQPIAEAEATATAREILAEARKEQEQAQDVAERRKRREAAPWEPQTPGEIWTWLDKQPDADFIRTAAKKEATLTCGTKANAKTVLAAMQGCLWREFERRKRAQFRQIAQG